MSKIFLLMKTLIFSSANCSEIVSMLAKKERGYDGAVCIFGLKVEFEAQCKAFVLMGIGLNYLVLKNLTSNKSIYMGKADDGGDGGLTSSDLVTAE